MFDFFNKKSVQSTIPLCHKRINIIVLCPLLFLNATLRRFKPSAFIHVLYYINFPILFNIFREISVKLPYFIPNHRTVSFNLRNNLQSNLYIHAPSKHFYSNMGFSLMPVNLLYTIFHTL